MSKFLAFFCIHTLQGRAGRRPNQRRRDLGSMNREVTVGRVIPD